jgi:PhoPQ-activated pathogenicity-related protein
MIATITMPLRQNGETSMIRLVAMMGVALALGTYAWAQPVLDYVNAPDDSFAWEVVKQEPMTGGMLTELKVTSQVWQGITWTHRVNVFLPDGCSDPGTALMMITGGSPGGSELVLLSSAGVMLSAPVVILGDIPNQPLFDNLREDALIAYTFMKYVETGDETWPLLFPMTKAAVRTMDAVEAWTADAWERPIERWVATGASKRGWTTWFTGVTVPERLEGIVPMVYDNLDLAAQMRLQVESFDGYSEEINDYTELGLQELLQTPEGAQLATMADPYALRDRATMPKLIINGSNDPYWPLEATNLYWDELPEPKYLLYVPNAGHGLPDIERVINAEVGFFKAATGRIPLPEPAWEFDYGSYLKLMVDPGEELPVLRVNQWTAHADTRDFRGSEWRMREALQSGEGYIARARYPLTGYTALFAEIVYEADGREFPLSTNVRIIGPRG